jgi:acyl carrier protein
MEPSWAIGAIGLGGAAAAVTGWWRYAFRPFGINPRKMTVDRLGLHPRPADVERIDGVLAAFSGGFNQMIARPSVKAWEAYCDALPVFFQPFAQEGAAMGYVLRQLGRYSSKDFEARIVRPRPEFRYLYYVGLGFWAGMRNYSPDKLSRMVAGLDPLHGSLVYDGYGFKYAFFDYRERGDAGLEPLNRLTGYPRRVAHQGVGRAMWFLFSGNPEMLIDRMDSLKTHAADAAAGTGLASVFLNPDRLEVAQEFGRRLPAEWRDSFHLGMCFALKARAINEVDEFERNLDRAEPAVAAAARESIRLCDRAELLIRDDAAHGPDAESLDVVEEVMDIEDDYDMAIPDATAMRFKTADDAVAYVNGRRTPPAEPYRDWRDLVTEWMTARIEFPMMSVRPATAARERSAAATRGR